MAVDKKVTKKRRSTTSKEPQKSRPERQLHRLKQSVEKETGGAKSICLKCHQSFNQVWMSQYEKYSDFDMCPTCRLEKARAQADANANDGVRQIMLPYTPHEKQVLIHQSPARFKLLAAGSRFGKDRCMVMEFIQKFAEMISEDRGPELVPTVYGWFVAPTYKMASQIWREFQSYFPREWVVDYWKSDYQIATINGGIIEVRSADDPDSLVGVGLDIVQITEAARIRNLEEVWANLETRLMSPGRGPDGKGGIALINSTPRGAHTQFHRMFRWGQKDDPLYDPNWESWQFASFENPYLNREDSDFFERIKKRYPERVYRQEILAEFLADGQSVFPTAEECATYDGPETPEPGETYVIGWDPARSIDYSGVAIRNSKGQVVRVEQWSGKSWTTQVDLIASYSQLYNYAHIVVDRTGLGETLPEALMQRGLSVEAVYFSNQEKEKMVNHLALLIEQKAISYPNNPVLIAELKDYGYTMTPSGNVKYGNSSKGTHDDLCTALFLCMKSYNLPEITIPWMGLLGGIKKK